MPLPELTLKEFVTPHWNGLEWMPASYRKRGSEADAEGIERGANSDYPFTGTAAQVGRGYWRPQQYIVTQARIVSPEYGEQLLATPIVPDGYRPNEVEPSFVATKGHHLLRGIGGGVSAFEFHTEGPSFNVSVDFRMGGPFIMEGGNLYSPAIFASIACSPFSTFPIGRAASKLDVSNLYGQAQCGVCKLRIMDLDIEHSASIALFRYVNAGEDSYPWCESIQAFIEVDFAPWHFGD